MNHDIHIQTCTHTCMDSTHTIFSLPYSPSTVCFGGLAVAVTVQLLFFLGIVHCPGSGLPSQASCSGLRRAGAPGVRRGLVWCVVPLEHICFAGGREIERLDFFLRAQGRAMTQLRLHIPSGLFNLEFPQLPPYMYFHSFQQTSHKVISYWHSREPVSPEYALGRLFFLSPNATVGREEGSVGLLCVCASLGLAGCHHVWNFVKDKEPAMQTACSDASTLGRCRGCVPPALGWLLPCRSPRRHMLAEHSR